MLPTTTLSPAPLDVVVAGHPSLADIARRVGANLFVACVVPAALFYVLLSAAGVWPAILGALVLAYGAIAWRAATGRRTSGLLVLSAILLTGRTAISLLAGSAFLYFLQPVLSDGVVAVAFLASLTTARPMVARLAGDFYPMDGDLASRPRVRRLFWWLTLMWATLCLGRAVMTWFMLESMSVHTFVLVKTLAVLLINVVAIGITIATAVRVAKREGVLTPALA